MSKAFNKPAITYKQQVELLKNRGMFFADEEKAARQLSHINYYRLCAYWLPFEKNHASHEFKDSTHFEKVLRLYAFDRELRLLVLDGIELVEVSIRARLAYQLAHIHGPHAHLDKELFDSRFWYRNLSQLIREVERSKETFILHFKENYFEMLPPIWAVCEVMSLGSLSRFYGSLQIKSTRSAIASGYQIDEALLQSWLHHLSLVRNICAHHSRLWNREFTVTPKHPRSKPAALSQQLVKSSRQLYNTLVILAYLTEAISSNKNWQQALCSLLNRCNPALELMGFPSDWQNRAIWQSEGQ